MRPEFALPAFVAEALAWGALVVAITGLFWAALFAAYQLARDRR